MAKIVIEMSSELLIMYTWLPVSLYRQFTEAYYAFEYVWVQSSDGNELTRREQGCAFLYRLVYWSDLAYFVCQNETRFFNTNKLAQKAFIDSLGVKTPNTLQVCAPSSLLECDIVLPSCDFVLKPIDGYKSLGLFIVRGDMEIIRKEPFQIEKIQEKIRSLKQITCDYVFEELLVGEDGSCPPPLYKFFIVGDKIVKILYIGQYDTTRKQADLIAVDEDYVVYELDWVTEKPYANFECKPPPKPLCWDEMLRSVKKIGTEMEIFTRVDFFATTRGAVFGEFSFGWDPSDWTPKCSEDLTKVYLGLPKQQQKLMIPNPFSPNFTTKHKTSTKSLNPYRYYFIRCSNIAFMFMSFTLLRILNNIASL